MNKVKIKSKNLNVHYGQKQALFDVNLDLNEKEVTALIGPSGCGKSTFIRCINRMNDVIDICKVTGNIEIDGVEVNDENLDVVSLRERVGMVFQKPNPFPKSIYENISYGPKIHGKGDTKSELDEIVENSLKKSALWEEVKDRLDEPGTSLSGGQQQRLCIARAISVNPEVILMDEPCSALDPIATAKIEELIDDLKKTYTIVIVTHSMAQAVRVSQKTGFFHLGKLIEVGKTEKIFKNPELQDPIYETAYERQKDKQKLEAIIQTELLKENSDYWLTELEKESVPCARVNNLEQAINDVQVQHRNMLVDVPHPEGGSTKIPGNPIKLSSVKDEEFLAPPLLGEHTKEVLENWLGFSINELKKLDKQQIIEIRK